jgi:VWFA-related protein
MRNTAKLLLTGLFALLVATAPSWHPQSLLAQGARTTPQAPPKPVGTVTPQSPLTIRVISDLVSSDVIVRDSKNQFVADLKKEDFEIYEDGVKQDTVVFSLIHGGRTFTQQVAPVAAASEGLLIPARRPTNDASGRVFIIFVDDLHLDFRMTPKTRELLKKISKNLLHDGDMYGLVTTGTSSVSQQLTYDKQILDSAIERITGNAMKLSEIRQSSWSTNGPSEVRHRAHVAFETLNDLLKNLESIQNKRKAVIFLSSGYDFNPLVQTRFEDTVEKLNTTAEQLRLDPFQLDSERTDALNEADLVYELTYITRMANRANATLYPIDPRGLVAGQDVDEEVAYADWQDWLRETQTSLLVLGEETNGFAIVNQNDFDKGIRRIDAETSDYYMVGFYSKNPDPLKRNRKLEVKVVGRPDLSVSSRKAYVLRSPTPPTPSTNSPAQK